jgi:hypothetical protein
LLSLCSRDAEAASDLPDRQPDISLALKRRNCDTSKPPWAWESGAMNSVQNNGGTTGRITSAASCLAGSGNPGGGPKGLARATRELVGEDGMILVELWRSIASDPMRRDADRLGASRLLADRGWGKPATFESLEGDPLDLADVEAAAAEFRSRSCASRIGRSRTRRKPRIPVAARRIAPRALL